MRSREEYKLQDYKIALPKECTQRLKKAQKTHEKLKQELQKCMQWEKVQHEGLLLQANIYKLKKGQQEISVSDWNKEGEEHFHSIRFRLQPKDSRLNKRFKLSKKLR